MPGRQRQLCSILAGNRSRLVTKQSKKSSLADLSGFLTPSMSKRLLEKARHSVIASRFHNITNVVQEGKHERFDIGGVHQEPLGWCKHTWVN
jgi:hypothetical protein